MQGVAEVIILPGPREAGELVADHIVGEVQRNPRLVLGVATGTTPLPIYGSLRDHADAGVDFSRVRAFALDEYVGLPEDHQESYHAVIDPGSVGIGVSTFVMVTLKGHNKDNIEKFIAAIRKIDEIVECHHITGAGDFILKIVAADISAYQQLMLEKVSNIEVVDSLQSMVILSTFKDSKTMPLPVSA